MAIRKNGQTASHMADPKGDARVEGLTNEPCAIVNLRISRDFSAHQKKSTFSRFFRAVKKSRLFRDYIDF